MPGGHLAIFMLLLWPFVGRGIGEQKVNGVLGGRAVIHTCHSHEQNVTGVEWTKYRNSTSSRLLYMFEKLNATCMSNCLNTHLDLQDMSLILTDLTAEDEAIYVEKTVFVNGPTKNCNISLSVLYPPTALGITVSSSRCPLTLRCEVRGEFFTLLWFRDGLPLLEDQRISFNDTNRTMSVSCLSVSDWGTYTCQVSNANGTSKAHINITGVIPGETTEEQNSHTIQILYLAGGTLTAILILCIILMCICKYGCCRTDPPDRRRGHRRANGIAMEEAVYDEPVFRQVQPDTPRVDPLPYVYSDFIKPKTQSGNKEASEDFGYSTIEEVKMNTQPLQTPT